MNLQPVTQIDGYKVDHRRQYPEGTEIIVSNLTARSTRRPYTDKVVFAGLQYFVKEYLIKQWNENFFSKPLEEVIASFNRRINNYLGPNSVGDQHIRDLHALGYLPLMIISLPEGTEHPIKVPSLMIWNTDPNFFWLTNYLETILSTSIWGMCTSATTAHNYKKILVKYAMDTVGNIDFVQWQGHDFSFRGMFGVEAACMSGAAHLFSFTGTDTIPAIDFLEEYYNADSDKELVGGSVAATEHSVACSTILNFVDKVRIEHSAMGQVMIEDDLMNLADIEYVRHLITDIYPTGVVSIVADSFDYWNTITNTAKVLKDVILARDGKVVFRPDTGDPVKVVVGDTIQSLDATNFEDAMEMAKDELADFVGSDTPHGECGLSEYSNTFKYRDKYYKGTIEIFWNRHDKQYYYIDEVILKSFDEVQLTPESKGSIECLWEIFGGTITSKGYRLLDGHVGLIYGDSITIERCTAICEGLKLKTYCSFNIVFGIGSFTYQYVTRDTDGYAVKATFARINGQDKEIYKSPKGPDAAFKKSAKGLTAVYKDDTGEFYLKDQATWDEVLNCEYIKVFENGQLLVDYSLSQVRANLAKYL